MQVEMTIKGLILDPVTNDPDHHFLRDQDGQRVLPIRVGAAEANAIGAAD